MTLCPTEITPHTEIHLTSLLKTCFIKLPTLMACATNNESIIIYNFDTSCAINEIKTNTACVTLKFLSRVDLLAVDATSARIFNIKTNKVAQQLAINTEWHWAVTADPFIVLAGETLETLTVWNTAAKTHIQYPYDTNLEYHLCGIEIVSDTTFATGHNFLICVWNYCIELIHSIDYKALLYSYTRIDNEFLVYSFTKMVSENQDDVLYPHLANYIFAVDTNNIIVQNEPRDEDDYNYTVWNKDTHKLEQVYYREEKDKSPKRYPVVVFNGMFIHGGERVVVFDANSFEKKKEFEGPFDSDVNVAII